VGGLKIVNNYIYNRFNVTKNVRGLTPRARTPTSLLCCHAPGCCCFTFLFTALLRPFSEPARDSYKPATFMTRSPTPGIEPGPPAWESSTLPSEPLDVRKDTSIFWTYIVSIHVQCMLHFHLSTFITEI
jgi:hypothetical protein